MITLKLADGQVSYEVNAMMDVHDPQERGPVRLVGFQNDADVQRVNLFVKEWLEDPQQAVGKFPVFSRGERGLYVVTLPVEAVEEEQ
jgi:hypothetical protein